MQTTGFIMHYAWSWLEMTEGDSDDDVVVRGHPLIEIKKEWFPECIKMLEIDKDMKMEPPV